MACAVGEQANASTSIDEDLCHYATMSKCENVNHDVDVTGHHRVCLPEIALYIVVIRIVQIYEECCVGSGHQGQGQTITSYIYCGMLLLVPALDTCFGTPLHISKAKVVVECAYAE